MLFRLKTKPTWRELRGRLVDLLPATFPGTQFGIAGDDESPPWLTWHEGPAETTVARALGPVPGWYLQSAMLEPDPQMASSSMLELHRSYSERAIALAVVRFHASNPRPYASCRSQARARLWAILDTDDPTSASYPLAAAMAEELLAVDQPESRDAEHVELADRLSSRLVAIGYERLWSWAWANVSL